MATRHNSLPTVAENINGEIDKFEASGAFDCDAAGTVCKGIVRSDQEGQEETRFVCTFMVRKTMPEDDCEAVQATDGMNKFLAAITGWKERPKGSGGSSIRIEVPIQKPWTDKSKISAAIRSALSDPRLSLTEDGGHNNHEFQYSCPSRMSAINKRWEMMTVRVYTDEFQDQSFKEYEGIEADFTLWVNTQNTERPVDWHRPSDGDEDRVTHEIDKNIRSRDARVPYCP